LFLWGVVEGQSDWLLTGIETMRQATALSDDASLTLMILRACAKAAPWPPRAEPTTRRSSSAARG
jgi:hypothetical protein